MKPFAVIPAIVEAVGSFRSGCMLCYIVQHASGTEWRYASGELADGCDVAIEDLIRHGWIARVGRQRFTIAMDKVREALLRMCAAAGPQAGAVESAADGQSEASGEAEHPQLARDIRELTKAMAWLWSDRLGGIAPYGRIGRVAKQLLKLHDVETIVAAWKNYLSHEQAMYISPERFAERVGLFIPKIERRETDTKALISRIAAGDDA